MVVKGQAGAALLDSYQAERAPIGKQIVDRANKSIEEFGPIFQALGLLDTKDPADDLQHGRSQEGRPAGRGATRGAAPGDCAPRSTN